MSPPLKICRFGSMCFRLNPVHFDEFSHPHLDAILKEGIKPATGEYNIPSNCPKEKVTEQLKIVKSKQDKSDEPPKKIPKLEVTDLTDSPVKGVRNISISTPGSAFRDSKSPATAKVQSTLKFEVKSPATGSRSNPDSSSAASKSFTSSKNSQTPSTSSTSSFGSYKTALQKKQDDQDYFKERAKIFKAKNPEEMKAPSPPPKPAAEKKTFNPTKQAEMEAAMRKFLPVILPRGKMAEKLEKAAPYNIFLTTITAAKETHSDPLSVTFQELLDQSLGELESSVQFNFMVDVAWLMAQYAFARVYDKPLLILYGNETDDLRDINKKRPNVTALKVNIPTPIGVHHTKMMLMFYKDSSMRVIISTANLYEDDWDNRTQGLWISDKLPALGEGVPYTSNGESETKFREDLMRYLIAYNIPKLQPIIAKIRQTDFSSVNVFFISSVPGTHRDSGKGIHYGHPRLASILSEHSAPVDDSNPIILQASSIGSLGASAAAYLTGEIANSFKRDSAPVGIRRLPNVKFIYPSLTNVIASHDGMAGGGCLPYGSNTHEKQRWLNDFLYQWKASSRNRNQAMPHIKSYCRFSDRGLYWFVLTSANVSRSAWGTMSKNNKSLNPSLRINSYEVGVAFLPRVIIGKERFPMNEAQKKDDTPIFKLPYDATLIPYGKDDVPYCAEYLKAHLAKYGA